MRRACEYAKMFGLPIFDHCQDYSLVTDGVMHEGYWSTALGLRGWPSAGEEMIVARNILLADLTGAKIHCQHLSAAGSVALLREAKKRGVSISGEACPHHFVLTDAAVAGRLDLEQALAQISAEERRAIECRYYQGLDGTELAAALGVSTPGAARVRVCRALQALRTHFTPAEEEVFP